MYILAASSSAVGKQHTNNRHKISFQKNPQNISEGLLHQDSFVKFVVNFHQSSDATEKVKMMSDINQRLIELYTQRLQPFWERLRTKNSVENEIAAYKKITASIQQEYLPI